MDDELPLEYDVIVVGTGMTESIVAAAISRIGKKVLHLDSNDYYGNLWASHNFENFLKLVESVKNGTNESYKTTMSNVSSHWFIEEDEPVLDTPTQCMEESPSHIEENVSSFDTVTEKEDHEIISDSNNDDDGSQSTLNNKPVITDSKQKSANVKPDCINWTQTTLKKEYRKFNIDLTPKLLFARGDLVELLISSNIARYTEFKSVNRVITWLDNILEPVPCSRADVFATKHVSVVEKRMLMKLLSSFIDYSENNSNEFSDIENKTFLSYLKSKKITNNLIHYVLYAIASGNDSMSCKEGMMKCKKFLTSLGRYGTTPFLWPMYGCGELPQCFCRLCAVYGGIYYLNRSIDNIQVSDTSIDISKNVTVSIQNKELKCEHVVMNIDQAPKELLQNINFNKGISRAIFITNQSILDSEKEPLTLLHFPPLKEKSNPVTIIELGPSTYACPKGLYLLHMTCAQSSTAMDDLSEYAEKLLDLNVHNSVKSHLKPVGKIHEKPQVLWCVYFNMVDTSSEELILPSMPHTHICSGPDIQLDYDYAIKQAREIFLSIYQDAEFLPRAPDPDELVFDDEDIATNPVFEKDVKPKTTEPNTNENNELLSTEDVASNPVFEKDVEQPKTTEPNTIENNELLSSKDVALNPVSEKDVKPKQSEHNTNENNKLLSVEYVTISNDEKQIVDQNN